MVQITLTIHQRYIILIVKPRNEITARYRRIRNSEYYYCNYLSYRHWIGISVNL